MLRSRPRRRLGVFAALALGALVAGLAAPATTSAQSPRFHRLELGAYTSGFAGTASPLTQFESRLGDRVTIASSFRGWHDIFPDATQRRDAATGHTLLVAWDLGATAWTRFRSFPEHRHDWYLGREARAAREYGRPLYIRPWPEMNGDWTAFQPTPDGSRPAGGTYAQFRRAWRYVVTFFRRHGATNVRWVFNPTADTYAQTTPINRIWPGWRYVDVLGLDGYNWGNGGIFAWRSFADIYAKQYHRLVALAPNKPVWICEVGSKEPQESDGAPPDPRHSKASWYAGMFAFLAHTHVRAVVMFDVRKERDWRVESDPATLSVVGSVTRAGGIAS